MKKFLSIMLLGGALALSGCGNDNEFVITGNNNPGIAAPVCAADAYTTNANTALTVPAATGVLANDTPNGASPIFDATSANGGTIAGAADGGFTYTPAANFAGTDTFSYRLTNSGGTVTCTVTITVVAVNGFFVDAANGNDGTGSFTNGLPFATVQAAVAAASTNQDIVVRPGSYTGTVTLKNGQRLLGSGSVLAQGVVRPTLTGPVVMADGCTLDFLRIANTPATVGAGDGLGDAVIGDGRAGGTVTNCEIDSSADEGFSGTNISGTWTISNNVLTNVGGGGIGIVAQGASLLTFRVENNQVTNATGALGLISEGTSNVAGSVKGNTFTTSAGAGSAFELTCGENSTFCLDLETNTNDNQYRLVETATSSELSVEQLSTLTDPQPVGAGNTGTVSIATGLGFDPIAEVADGFCGF